jgi:aconitate hydratase
MTTNSSGARGRLEVGDVSYEIFRLDRVDGSARLPYSLKVLLENPLRNQDGTLVTAEQVAALVSRHPAAETGTEIGFTSARVLLQDFTGVPRKTNQLIPVNSSSTIRSSPTCSPDATPSGVTARPSWRVHEFGEDECYSRRTAALRRSSTSTTSAMVPPLPSSAAVTLPCCPRSGRAGR